MKINIFCKSVILLGLAVVFSCGQDPIFYTISTETKPQKPRIEGGPTNMVVFNREYPDPNNEDMTITVPIMYVASGRLHWYARKGRGKGASEWDLDEYEIPKLAKDDSRQQPKGKIIGLAATNEHLYALFIGSGVTTELWRIGPAVDVWEQVQIEEGISYTLIQSIFADKETGRLFAGAMNRSGSDYGILYLNDTGLKLLEEKTELLSGAASRNGYHYLCTRGKGIFMAEETKLLGNAELPEQLKQEPLDDNDTAVNDRLFMGMIKLEDESIIVVERKGGAFFEVLETGFRQIKYSDDTNVATGKYATGALAVWNGFGLDAEGNQVFDEKGDRLYGNEKMLIAGIQGGLYNTTTSSYTHGYVEFYLTSNGSLNLESSLNNSRNDPPSISVHDTNRYTANIGKHPINHLFKAPPEIDDNITFFASTQTAGLWAYRYLKNGGWQWNAEK
jgi:hypothetical protein